MVEQTLRMYRAYCWINVIWYVLIGSFGVGVFILAGQLPPEDVTEAQITVLRNGGLMLALIGLVFSTLAMGLMRQVINSKNWLTHFINICLGISTCCLAPFCIVLAIKWNSKEFKQQLEKAQFEL